jgi:hypothetical protein
MWMAVANDCFGVVTTPDDYRTNQVSLFARIGSGLIVGADHSMLTSVPSGIRSDELTLTAGWLPFGENRPWVVLGGGLKLVGDLGGESVQDRWHTVIGMDRYHLAYEEDDTRAVAFALVNQSWLYRDRVGAAASASSLVSSGGEVQAEAAAWGVARGASLTAWAGLRGRARGGHEPTRVAGLVAEFEEGLWIEYGIGVGWFAFSGAYDPVEGVSSGTITVDLAVP